MLMLFLLHYHIRISTRIILVHLYIQIKEDFSQGIQEVHSFLNFFYQCVELEHDTLECLQGASGEL
jgi:hypothetical protein